MTPIAAAICEQPKTLDRPGNRVVKRIIDIVGAVIGLTMSIPIVAIFAWLIVRESPGPVLYRQKRTGRNGRDFFIIKLRSMRPDAETNGPRWAEENDKRCLRIGFFMRRWNIDEVPQFWNVLKGDMSLVGPRPERPEYILNFKRQIPNYAARHLCMPGMSGWAQVHGWRGNTSVEKRTECDLWYAKNWSLGLDFRIMLKTLLCYKNAC